MFILSCIITSTPYFIKHMFLFIQGIKVSHIWGEFIDLIAWNKGLDGLSIVFWHHIDKTEW